MATTQVLKLLDQKILQDDPDTGSRAGIQFYVQVITERRFSPSKETLQLLLVDLMDTSSVTQLGEGEFRDTNGGSVALIKSIILRVDIRRGEESLKTYEMYAERLQKVVTNPTLLPELLTKRYFDAALKG